jgi:hypothetical protein
MRFPVRYGDYTHLCYWNEKWVGNFVANRAGEMRLVEGVLDGKRVSGRCRLSR